MSERLPRDTPPDKTHVLIRTTDSSLYCRGFYFGHDCWTCEGAIVRPEEIAGWLPMPTVTSPDAGATSTG